MSSLQATNQASESETRPFSGAATWSLVWTMIRTDFKARYHGTLGGFVWALLRPLALFGSLIAVFSFVFTGDRDYRINLLIGLFLWDFFSSGTRTGLSSLQQKSFLLTKARFPPWIVVATSISNSLITLLVFDVAITVYVVAAGRFPGSIHLFIFLAYQLCFALVVIGISLASSVLYLRFRDLNEVWDVISSAGFFLTPIVWPISAIPERYHFYLYFWPPVPFIDFARKALVAAAIPPPRANAFLLLETGVVLLVGALAFKRGSIRAAEYL